MVQRVIYHWCIRHHQEQGKIQMCWRGSARGLAEQGDYYYQLECLASHRKTGRVEGRLHAHHALPHYGVGRHDFCWLCLCDWHLGPGVGNNSALVTLEIS